VVVVVVATMDRKEERACRHVVNGFQW
jgi:hypothetical protein